MRNLASLFVILEYKFAVEIGLVFFCYWYSILSDRTLALYTGRRYFWQVFYIIVSTCAPLKAFGV